MSSKYNFYKKYSSKGKITSKVELVVTPKPVVVFLLPLYGFPFVSTISLFI